MVSEKIGLPFCRGKTIRSIFMKFLVYVYHVEDYYRYQQSFLTCLKIELENLGFSKSLHFYKVDAGKKTGCVWALALYSGRWGKWAEGACQRPGSLLWLGLNDTYSLLIGHVKMSNNICT